jgi:hypothetical protein
MVEILGEYYYLNIDKITESCELTVDVDTDEDGNNTGAVDQTINVFKYDTIKMCLDTILTEAAQDDNGMGLLNSELSIPFKIAFNTLIKYQILTKEDE